MWLEQNLPLEKWVYAVKLGANGEEKHATKGYSQISEIEYHETFSPTARITSLRVFIQLAMGKYLIVHQMDVQTTYLNATIDCEIHLKQPEGYKNISRKW